MQSQLYSEPSPISNERRQNQKQQIKRIYTDCEFNLAPSIDGKVSCDPWGKYQSERLPVEQLCAWSRGEFTKDGTPWKTERFVQWCLITGEKPWSKIPGIVVFDADDAEAMQLVEARCPKTPLRTSTPGGGMHYIYRHPGITIRQILTHTIKGKKFKLDRKADGNYVMMPGTCRDDGRIYSPSMPWTPEVIQSLPIFDPNWIVDERREEKSKIQIDPSIMSSRMATMQQVDEPFRRKMAQLWLDRQPGARQGTGADGYCFSIAMRLLWGFCLEAEDATDLLSAWGERQDQRDSTGSYYPWKWHECHHKIRDAARKQYQYPGDLWEDEFRRYKMYQLDKIFNNKNDHAQRGQERTSGD